MTIRGTCDSCGKAYRLPSGGRAYSCKACGGTVRAEAAEPEAEELVDLPPDAHHVTAREHRERIDAIHRAAARRTRLVYGGVLVVVLAVAIGYELTRRAPVQAAEGVARDLEAGTAELVQAWNAGDVAALVRAYHPQGREEFRARLQRVIENRGWTDGFVPARPAGASLVEGTTDRPVKATTLLACGEDELRVRCSLQFEPLHERWYVYHVDISPPPLAPTLARFRAAWEQSSPQALAPLFPPDDAQKLTALVERKARELGWSPTFPALGEATTTGEEELRRATERVPGLKVESVLPVPDGALKLRWQYRAEPDTWYVAAVTFPQGE
jgi:hypothetical protein